MIYENYNIRFVRLKVEHLELLRYWRNHSSINQYMEFQEMITFEMQKKWFEKIQQDKSSLYFLIEYDHNFIGMINGKDIDLQHGSAEGGLFIWDLNFQNTEIPIRSILSFADFAYLFCEIKKCYINILNDNKKSIELNKNFGYKLIDGQEDKKNQKYVVAATDFLDKTALFKKHYKKIYKKHPSILFEKKDFEYGWADYYIQECCDDNKQHSVFSVNIED